MSRVCALTPVWVSFFFKGVCNVVSPAFARMSVWVNEFLLALLLYFLLFWQWDFFHCVEVFCVLVQKSCLTFSYYFLLLFNILSILLHHHHHHFRGTLSYKLTKNRKLLHANCFFFAFRTWWCEFVVIVSNGSTALLRICCGQCCLKMLVLLCSPEGFDFSHICLYVCVCVRCDWLLWSPHSRAHFSSNGCFVCVRGVIFSGKKKCLI